jgi:alpha-galactosidase/6-phospho-beta-glucosidase family protein
VLEYSLHLDQDGVHPDPDLEVPDCYHGLISALATHQTLLGDAIATRDPKLFAAALFTYPLNQNTRETRTLWRELLEIHAAEMPADFQKAKDYF